MKKILLVLAVLSLLLIGSGCAAVRAPVVPPIGWLYTSYKAPLMTDYHGTELGSKKGTAKTQYLLFPWIWLDFAWGDAAIREAAEEGGITNVRAADYEFMQVLGTYAEFTVHAYGD